MAFMGFVSPRATASSYVLQIASFSQIDAQTFFPIAEVFPAPLPLGFFGRGTGTNVVFRRSLLVGMVCEPDKHAVFLASSFFPKEAVTC